MNAKLRRRLTTRPLTEPELKRGVLDGTIPSAVSDTGATSSAGLVGDPFIDTDEVSTKVFHLPTGGKAPASKVVKLEHNLREPARTVDMVPDLVAQTLLSASKFADANYISIYDGKEVNIYDALTTKIIVSEAAVLKGWRCPKSKLWRIPLKANVQNINTDTLLLDSPDGHQSLNAMYTVPSTHQVCRHMHQMLHSQS